MEKELENINMDGDENSKNFCPRAELKLNVLSTLGILKFDSEFLRLITRRLPSELYDVEQRTTFLRPGITRSEMEEIMRTSDASHKTKTLEERKFAAIVSTSAALANPYAIVVFGGFQENNGGRHRDGTGQQQQS